MEENTFRRQLKGAGNDDVDDDVDVTGNRSTVVRLS